MSLSQGARPVKNRSGFFICEDELSMKPPEKLETKRLILRLPGIKDAEEIFAQYAQDAEVTKYLTWQPNRTLEETRDFLHLCLAGWEIGKSFQWVIVRKEDNQLLGMAGFRADGHKLELGYVLAKAYWGKGYMTEAVRVLVDWALSRDEIYRVWAVCDAENKASVRVLEKVGMELESVLRRWSIHPNRSDQPRDSYCYAKTK
jgi:RimJ/RimL family protein N-acetyltransferase